MPEPRRRRRWPWILIAALVVVLVPVGIVAVPILTHQSQGLSNQGDTTTEFPTTVTATGDDGRTRELTVISPDPGGAVDTAALTVGERLVVSGTGYDGSRGIYVAICVIPDDPATKPGPCIGGVPDQEQEQVDAGHVVRRELPLVLPVALREVEAREQQYRVQLQQLQVEIDHTKRQREVAEIEESEYFKNLQKTAKTLKNR